MRIVVTGGGTGGHIYPALAIADKIMEHYPGASILYVGTPDGIESRIVPEYGYDFATVDVKGFQRKLSAENLKRGGKVVLALRRARTILKRFRADLVIGTGGYVCGPVLMAAKWLGCSTAIHEQNAFPGVTNRILSRFVDRIYLGYEEARGRFPKGKQIIYVGNPVREDLYRLNRDEAREELGIDKDNRMILTIGGSGGSVTLNNAFLELLPHLLDAGYAFDHPTGARHYDAFYKQVKGYALQPDQEIKQYEKNVPLYMAASDLVICSGGAGTLAEVNAVGRASIVIPKAYTAENHQEYNARIIESKGAGYFLLEKDCTGENLWKLMNAVLHDDTKRREMEINSRALSKEGTCDLIVQDIFSKYFAELSYESK